MADILDTFLLRIQAAGVTVPEATAQVVTTELRATLGGDFHYLRKHNQHSRAHGRTEVIAQALREGRSLDSLGIPERTLRRHLAKRTSFVKGG